MIFLIWNVFFHSDGRSVFPWTIFLLFSKNFLNHSAIRHVRATSCCLNILQPKAIAVFLGIDWLCSLTLGMALALSILLVRSLPPVNDILVIFDQFFLNHYCLLQFTDRLLKFGLFFYQVLLESALKNCSDIFDFVLMLCFHKLNLLFPVLHFLFICFDVIGDHFPSRFAVCCLQLSCVTAVS